MEQQMTLSKDEFTTKIQPLLTEPVEKLPITNPQFITFTEDFIDKNGSKFFNWSILYYLMALVLAWGIPLVAYAMLGKKKFCWDLSYRDSINIKDLYDAYSKDIQFDVETEIPVLFHSKGLTEQTRLLLTNKHLYYRLSKSAKIKDSGQKSIGKISLADINSFDVEPHSIHGMLSLKVNGEQIGSMHCSKAQSKSANNLRMLFQNFIMKKSELTA
jgi:hypothetical protein